MSKAKVTIVEFGRRLWAAPINPDGDARLPLVVKWVTDESQAFAFYPSDVEELSRKWGGTRGEDPSYRFKVVPMTPDETKLTEQLHSKLGVQPQPVNDDHAEYLGDSVYVALRNGMVRLSLNNGDGEHDVIFLEPQTLKAFEAWLVRIGWRCQ